MDASDSRSLAAPVPRLPDDALVQILSRLRAKCLCRCKCVSKSWRDLIADRLGCKDLPQSLQGFLCFDRGSCGRGNGSDLASGSGKMLLRHGCRVARHSHGRFINQLGRPVSLLDPSFAFMKERPGVEIVALLESCNGLLLFGHKRVSDTYDSLGYIVCNPVTEQWVAVPSSGWSPTPPEEVMGWWDKEVLTFLIFDPSVSSHFDLVQLWYDGRKVKLEGVHTYSSVTGLWSDRASEWRGQGSGWKIQSPYRGRALVNGMLHIVVFQTSTNLFQIVAVDRQGRLCRVMDWPEQRMLPYVGFIGQSQGHLYCISSLAEGSGFKSSELSIWVLEDYDTEEWVLLRSLSLWHLSEGLDHFRYCFVGLHTDRNMMFFVYDKDQKLISYDMDSREVRVLCTLTPGHGSPYGTLWHGHASPYVTPYVPSLKSL